MIWSQRLSYIGYGLIGLGVLLLVGNQPAVVPTNASLPNSTAPTGDGVNYLGWGVLALGFLTLASRHYFKLREARRADRVEAREVHDRRRSSDDAR